MNKYRLRSKLECGGCGSKFPPKELQELLSGFNRELDKTIIHFEESEDACVFPIDASRSIVKTVDIIYPNVDDPYLFGRIATLNAVSDIYAMGAEPILGLNIAEFSSNLDSEILQLILKGAFDQSKEEGFSICGGHTLEGDSLKFGMSIMGFINPDKIIRNSGALPEDLIVLTKPIGSGLYSEAMKHNLLTEKDINEFENNLLVSNKLASQLISKFNVTSMTDVSGFGLAVHLFRILNNSSLSATIRRDEIPVLTNLDSFSVNKSLKKTYKNNFDLVSNTINVNAEDSRFFDPQTNGGLLFTASQEEVKKLEEVFSMNNLFFRIIGKTESRLKDTTKIKVI